MKTGKTSMRVIPFIHSALFLLCGFFFINTKRLSNQSPVKTRTFLIIFQTRQARNPNDEK